MDQLGGVRLTLDGRVLQKQYFLTESLHIPYPYSCGHVIWQARQHVKIMCYNFSTHRHCHCQEEVTFLSIYEEFGHKTR